MDTMGFFAASLSLNCVGLSHWGKRRQLGAGMPTTRSSKITSRKMVAMVNAINANNFGGAKFVTCWTCHRGMQQPPTIPSLLEQYSAPPPDDPNEYQIRADATGEPTADQVFAKYMQALGGEQKVAAVKSFAGKGTYEGYDTGHEQNPIRDLCQSAEPAHDARALPQSEKACASSTGTTRGSPRSDKPQPLMTLTGGELEGAKIDATSMFPAQLKATLPATGRWATRRLTTNPCSSLVGSAPGRSSVKLFFDKESGLLVRLVRYDSTVIGTNPIQIDYADYRDVNGVKMPFQMDVDLDGRARLHQADRHAAERRRSSAAQFAKPAPAKSRIPAGGGQWQQVGEHGLCRQCRCWPGNWNTRA